MTDIREMGIREKMNLAVQRELNELRRAAIELERPTEPFTPLPRPRLFQIAGEVRWPARGVGGFLHLERRREILSLEFDFHEAVAAILDEAGCQPRRVWHAIRQIQAAAEWCRRRAEGRRRHAAEILRQQNEYIARIEAEEAVSILAGM